MMAICFAASARDSRSAFEIVFMAADAGLVAGGEKVMAIAGTGRGCDTALVMQAASPSILAG